MHGLRLPLFVFFLAILASSSLMASPLAPDEPRVADSASGLGQLCGLGEGGGISSHPFFSVVHRATAPRRNAVKLRVQVSLDINFGALYWDSGFVGIAPTAADQRTPNLPYAGPQLLAGMTFYVRMGTQDDQGHSSPFSGLFADETTPAFTVAPQPGACDLRAQTDGANSQQGHPVPLPFATVGFSAEWRGTEWPANAVQVQVFATATFEYLLWDSEWINMASVNPGQRCTAIWASVTFEAQLTLFWRIRFKDSQLETSAWSAAGASFVLDDAFYAQPAPAGFGAQKRDLGIFGAISSDVAIADLNSDGVDDAVVVSGTAGESHAIHMSFGAANPGATLYFGAASGGLARVALLDLDLDRDLDIAVACGDQVTIYLNGGMTFVPCATLEIGGQGDLLDLAAADAESSGWPGLAVTYTNSVYWLSNEEGVFASPLLIGEFEDPIDDSAVEDLLDDGRPEFLVLSNGTLFAYGVKKGSVQDLATWVVEGTSQFAVAKGEGDYALDILTTGGSQVELRRLNANNAWDTLKQLTLEHGGRCHELLRADFNGASGWDVALLLDTGTLFCLQTENAFAEHEFAGYGQDGAHTRGAVCDGDLDGRADLLVLRPGVTTQLYLNKARRSVSIHDADAIQRAYGESYIDFEVALDAPSCSLIEVDCSTIEEEGEGDGDGISNLGPMARGLVPPLPYVPTTTRLYFVPGQTRAFFRVLLTKAALVSVASFQVRISGALGAVVVTPIATGTVYAPGASSSGPAAVSGMQRDWTLRGQVHSVAQLANGNTYFGGEFDGVEWQLDGVAALDALGTRQRALAGISGTIKAVAMDTDGSVFVGGHFELFHQGQWFKNIVKLRYDGTIDAAFRPNPDTGTGDGVVNAIALKSGSVYFGGRFSSLANCSYALKNIAQVFTTGAYPLRPDRFRVYHPYTYGEPAQQPAEVLSMLISTSGITQNEFLIVGGRNFDRAELSTGGNVSVKNLALFGLGGSIVPNMPRVFGEVRALAVSTEMFSNWGMGGSSRTILFGGNFEWVYFPKMGGSVYETRMNLNSTNFSGELKYSKHSSALSHTPVNALLVESGNRLWVGRNNQHIGLTRDPLALYTVTSGDFTQNSSFASGLIQPVRALALGDSEVLVAGDFSQRTTASGTVPVGRALLFSTQTLGAVSNAFRSSFDQSIICAASGRDAQNRLRGFVVGGSFTKLISQRGNLAAMNAAGELLPWGPSVDGPVYTLATDGTDIFFGGNFTAATGTQVFNRRSLASVPANDDAINVNNWIADISGSAVEVHALTLDGSSLVVGGDFTAINGTAREDAAAVSKTVSSSPWLAGVTPWDASLAHDAFSKVYVLALDGSNLYLGGSFSGTTLTPRPALLAVSAPSAGPTVLIDWDPALAVPCTVRALGVSNADVFFAGQFSSVGGATRINVAAVPKWLGTPGTFAPTAFAPAISGNLYSLAALPSGLVYVAGETLTVTVGSTPTLRRGVAAFDASGTLLSWQAPVLGTAGGELVRALLLDDSQAVARLWVGGNFSGTAHTGQHDLTWFTRAWNITTPKLPNANEDQAYGPVQVTLSETVTCTWSIYAPNAPWLSIDANTGEISGYCPLGAPALIAVLVTATQSPTVSTDKWFLLAVTPKPPPTTVSVSGPAYVTEGDAPLLDPAPLVTLSLNQLFSADVVIEVQYIDGTAFRGRDYAGPIRQAVILAGHWSVNIPLSIFGDTLVGNAQRAFTVRAVVLTPNVYVSPTAQQCVVTILEDDPAQPRHAIARELSVRESTSQLADRTHVMASQPVFTWSFSSDFSGDVQTGWQVQVFGNPAFTGSPLWDSGAQSGADSYVQLGAAGGTYSLTDGTNYFARVRLWSSPTEISDWLPLALRTNTPPPAAILDSPSGTVLLSRPTLKWETAADAEDDARQFKVTLTGATTLVFDSSAQPQLFERYLAATGQWVAFGQAGADTAVSKVRMTVPLGSALTAGSWDWTVETSDGFESAAAASGGVLTINVQPAYAASGRVLNGAVPDNGRTVSVYRMPGHTLLGSNTTNSSGEFMIPLGGSPVAGDILALVIDNPASPPPAYMPAYAASFVRFAGADLVEISGQNRSVELRHGRLDLDPRGQDPFTLSSLIDTSGDSDWPVAVVAGKLELRSEMTGFDLQGTLAVLGTAAAPGEPTVLALPGVSQEIRVNLGGALLVQEAASVETQALTNDGCVSLESGSALNLSAASTSSGQFVMQSGATLVLDSAQLAITGGYPQFLSADVHGVTGQETVLVQGGALSASGTGFHGVTLDIGSSGDVTDLFGAVFDGVTPDHRIGWNRQRDNGATLRGIRFEAGSTYNVAASADADKLTLIGCGGDLAGEAADSDPGEATAQDIVNWVLSTIRDSRAIAGDTRVLLVWNAGEQTGGGFTYNIHASATPGGQITLVGTTQNTFFVESNLQNGTPRYYYVELSAWGTHSTWSPLLEATPEEPALTSAFPISLRENGTAAGLAEGNATHFKSSTAISSPQSGVTVPASSIDVIGDSLILFDVETNAAALGMVELQITTPDVWAEHGAPAYAEVVSFQAEVKPPATPNYPSVAFVQTGGAVAPDALTDGAFAVAVEFDPAGGAEINPQSFECVVDRDIMVGGQVVAAGTNLAGAQLGLWGNVGASGATWQVDQIQVTTDPQEEFISRGELIISVRVGNAFGFTTPWNPMRIHVQGGDPDYAITVGTIEPGEADQHLYVSAACLVDTTYEAQFPQGSGITVQSVTTQTSGGISLDVTCSAAANAPIGSGSYSIIETSSQQIVATGVYHTKYVYGSLYASAGTGAGPRAATAAVNVILQTGDFFWTETDLATKARAFPIVWSRTYQSRKMGRRDTPLGKGWYGTYFQKVEIGSNSLRWLTASGEDVVFENPQSSGGVTTWLCPPGYNVTATTKTVGVNDECIITTSDGTRLTFQEGPWSSSRLKLREIRDPSLNLHVLEYDWQDERLEAIRGDTWGSGVSECLLLSYYKYGRDLLRSVQRVRAVKDGATSAPLDTVRYYYSWEQGLTLQRIPEGDRFSGHLYRGYTYDSPQSWTSAQRMLQIFPASQTRPDATLDPQDLDEWECEVDTGGTQAPVPGLTINYDPNTGRVESQVLGPVGGSSEREYVIAYNSGPPVERTVTPPSGSAGNVKYELNDDGQATKVTQTVPSPTGSGTVDAVTEYEFESLTQNLLMMKEPKGNCTYYTYAPGAVAVTGGDFWSLTPLSTQTLLSVPPGLISASAIGWVVKLFGVVQGGLRERYYIVAPGTTDGLLVVGANLLNDGWITGTSGSFALFNLNSNALSRSLLIQERRCAGAGWASTDLVTTYVRKDDKRYDTYYSNLTDTIDPWYNRTIISRAFSQEYLPLPDRSIERVRTCCYVKIAKDAVADDVARELQLSYNRSDVYGRPETVSCAKYEPTSEDEVQNSSSVSYLYYAVGQSVTPDAGKYPGQLRCVESHRSGSHTNSPKVISTTYHYDSRGNVCEVRLPRYETPGTFSASDFTSIVETNAAGQVIHTKGPASGTDSVNRTSESWMFYDKDGHLVQQCEKFVPLGENDPTAGNGSEQTESAIISAFARPTWVSSGTPHFSKGWIHTIYEYNEWGDLIKERRDLDIVGGQLIVAETNYGYDLEGRCNFVKDPVGSITVSNFDSRGLLTHSTSGLKFVSPGVLDSSLAVTLSFRYDLNGNLIEESDAIGLATKHAYDEFNRPVRTSHRRSNGFSLHEITQYPVVGGPYQSASLLANGSETSPVIKRGTRTLMDAASRAYRSWTIAQDSNGGNLHGAQVIDELPWSVAATQLNGQGQPEKSWTLTPENVSAQSQFYIYDGRGMTLDALGMVKEEGIDHAEFKYDAAGNCIYSSAPAAESNGQCASSIQDVIYDPCNQPWKITTKWQGSMQTSPQDVATVEYRRNNLGWPELVIDGAGKQTRTDFNFAGLPRRISVLEQGSAANITEREYYPNGALKKEVAYRADDPSGLSSATLQPSIYIYDARNRLTSIERAGVGTWHYYYNALDLCYCETRPDGTQIENYYSNGGDLTSRIVKKTSSSATSTSSPTLAKVYSEHYIVNEFGEIKSAITKDANDKLQTELSMDYNSLGQIENQTLTVYDAQGQRLSPYFIEHNWDPSELGFKSLYESNTLGYSSWPMTVKYDCLGRETEQTFWDTRQITSDYAGLIYGGCRDTSQSQSIRLVDYWINSALLSYARAYHYTGDAEIYRARSMRPSQPGPHFVANSTDGFSSTRFGADPHGGLADIIHGGWEPSGSGNRNFAYTETRYDKSGNPVLERSVHRGGLTRVMKYDHSNRLKTSYYGHLINAGSPGLILAPNDSNLNPTAAQWERAYTQDTLDNITGVSATVAGGTPVTTDMPVLSNTENVVGSVNNAAFGYDECKSVETDPTTGLTYSYNYRGQLESVTDGSVVIRQCTYDCFGRMVHQVEAPGTSAERGTIFVPNVGFGGGGEGADCAAEITYERDGSVLRGREVVQYTYGIGAMGGGLGRKRLVEFVAYCSEFAPYYRFLHEDTQGNTIATTSLWGDRLDEYDYTDYGVPLHAPVALDGRWITGVTATTTTDVSIVDLSNSNILLPNELIGCEFRVALKDAASAGQVFLAGTVISHKGSQVAIHDPGHALATNWDTHAHKPSACFYDIREGYYKGVIDSVANGTWAGQQVTFITVLDGPFESYMVSYGGSGPDVYVQLGTQSARVIGADQPADTNYPANGFKRLIVEGQGYSAATSGAWYRIKGNCTTEEIARCGTWANAASHSGGKTQFSLESWAELREEQLGWFIQPDINCQAWFPITGIDEYHHTLTVAGNHAALGAQGNRFRIFAPPGVEPRGPHAGLLPRFAEAANSRYLYKGYRYETAAAGRWDNVQSGVAARQGGSNFTGQHYTLFRHFDPSLMRFTSLDPIAASQNLWAYCDNNPHGAYDPDGLEEEKSTCQNWAGNWVRSCYSRADKWVGGKGFISGAGQIAGGLADSGWFVLTLPVQGPMWSISGEAPMPIQMQVNVVSNVGQRWDYLSRADESAAKKVAAVSLGAAADMLGVTSIGEAYNRYDFTTGVALSEEEVNARWVTGGFAMLTYAVPVVGKGLGLARTAARSIGAAIQESSASRPRVMLPRANRGTVLNPWRAFSRDPAIQEALQNGDIHEIRTHANRLDSSGPRTVYAVREAGTGKVLHIGETTDVVSRTRQHIADFKAMGKKVYVDPRRVVSGKQAALNLQERYIRTYERVFGKKPPFNKSYR